MSGSLVFCRKIRLEKNISHDTMYDMLISTIACVTREATQVLIDNAPFRRDHRRIYDHLRRLYNAYSDNSQESQYALLAYIFRLLSLECSRELDIKYHLEADFSKAFGDDLNAYLILRLLENARNDEPLAQKLCKCLLDGSKKYEKLADKLYLCLLDRANNHADLADRLLDYLIDSPELTSRLFEALKSCRITRQQ